MNAMKPIKTNPQIVGHRTAKTPGKQAIIRSVASSTAIETGQRIDRIESMLRGKRGKYRDLKLAR